MIDAGQQEFNDAVFKLFDSADATKKIAFQLSGITTGNTRTITVPDESFTLIDWTSTDQNFSTSGTGLIGGVCDLAADVTGQGVGASFFSGVATGDNPRFRIYGYDTDVSARQEYLEIYINTGGNLIFSGIFGYALWNISNRYAADVQMMFGDYGNIAFEADTGQTVDSGLMGLRKYSTTQSPVLIICEFSDMGFDFAHPQQVNPTLFLHSDNQSTTEWLSFHHDGTDGVIAVGTGNIKLSNSLVFADAKDIILNTTTGTKIGTATDQKLAFYNSTPIIQPSAYTQTYATADKTHAARTAAAVGDLVATSGGWGASSEVNFDKISDAIDKLVADQADTAQIVNSLIDDLQALGLAG